MQLFHHIPKGKYYPKKCGFVIAGMCIANRDLKVKPMKDFYKGLDCEYVKYIGIAIDEPKRLERLRGDITKVSLLEKFGYTESMARELSEEYGLLSPIYQTQSRNGCWFCPNMRIDSLVAFYNDYPDLWNELRLMGNTPNLISYGYKYGKSVHAIEKQILRRMKIQELQQRQLSLF